MDGALPIGGTIPTVAWQRRHRGITLILWAHAAVIPVYAWVRGLGVLHAIAESAVVPLAAILANRPVLSKRARMLAASGGLLVCSALLVHLSGGLIEMHFHFFVMIIIVSLYQDWRSFLVAVGFVLLHHGVVGVLSPESVYNHPAAIDHPWLFAAIHSGFVGAASAAALVNWRLSEGHLRAAARAEQRLSAEIRLVEKLSAAETVLAADLDPELVAQNIADVAVQLTSASHGALIYRAPNDAGGVHLVVVSAGGAGALTTIPGRSYDARRFDPTLDAGQTLRVGDGRGPTEGETNILWPGSMRSVLAVPIALPADTAGAIVLADERVGTLGDAEERAVMGLAAHASVVLENAHLYTTQRSAATTLQQSLLPDVMPTADGLITTARYLPADKEFDIGGDWYDAFRLTDGTLGLVMGDVVGRGLPAAALMGQMRNSLRAYALEGCSPGETFARLNDMTCALDFGFVATAVFAAIDPSTGVARIASAGHPPILEVGADGEARFLEVRNGLAFGCLDRAVYPDSVVELAPGSSFVLYTDGLVEDRDSSIDAGLERLRRAASCAPGDADALCEHILEHGSSSQAAADDTAILVVRRAPLLADPARREEPGQAMAADGPAR